MMRNELKNLTSSVLRLSSCRQAPSKLSGKYVIQVNETKFDVFCEQTNFGGDWIVIQHRFDGSVDFYRNWTEYRNGFGNLDGEFWLGLEHLYQLTKNRPHELIVELKDFDGNYKYARYAEFEVGGESEVYVLKKLGKYAGTVGDSFAGNKGRKFSTYDRDHTLRKCAVKQYSGWWQKNCSNANLNGRYEKKDGDMSSMIWWDFKGGNHGLAFSRMMIREIVD
ncbi:AGAP011225-PA-like protein [Anopheles sinensis]|uniref:AGAP011225-PA-like protein n=1 Tax=Anopheles sinensis TaxID=74873 RepID=A0A084VSX1_ANOSI|nr:AGAP011225-PA-like protein [Anopheles sinensis]